MINYNTSEPNARYWALKLLLDTFGPGDRLLQTGSSAPSFTAQALGTSRGKKLLIVNKRNRE